MQDNRITVWLPVGTIIMIAVNVIIFLILQFFVGDTEDTLFMAEHGAIYEPAVLGNGEYYRLITAMFMHFGFLHLRSNMITLGAAGYTLERQIGTVRFLILYFCSGIAANLCSCIYYRASGVLVVSAGASGAVFGLLGGILYVFVRNVRKFNAMNPRTKGTIVIMFLVFLFMALNGEHVNHLAHVSGLIFGFLLAIPLSRGKYFFYSDP